MWLRRKRHALFPECQWWLVFCRSYGPCLQVFCPSWAMIGEMEIMNIFTLNLKYSFYSLQNTAQSACGGSVINKWLMKDFFNFKVNIQYYLPNWSNQLFLYMMGNLNRYLFSWSWSHKSISTMKYKIVFW